MGQKKENGTFMLLLQFPSTRSPAIIASAQGMGTKNVPPSSLSTGAATTDGCSVDATHSGD